MTTKNTSAFDNKAFINTLSPLPGVYRMLDEKQQVLYIGKAKNLKKRVSSYFSRSAVGVKTQNLVKKINHIEVTVTASETEALLLEQSLIKSLKPPYNIVLRDDKSYPYIYLSEHSDYPKLELKRGSKLKKGRYFGPYPSTLAVRESLNLLQKVFKIRQCSESFFNNRQRPCLQYQIKRCSAPCVGLIEPGEYQTDIQHAVLFLEGKNHTLIDTIAEKMEQAAHSLDYELAAVYRDQISHLRRIQESQYVVAEQGHVDVIALVEQQACICIQILFIRDGQLLGNKNFFPKSQLMEQPEEILSEFIGQYYLSGNTQRSCPKQIITNFPVKDQACLEQALQHVAGHKVQLSHQVRSHRAQWLKLASVNATHSLQAVLGHQNTVYQRFDILQQHLDMEALTRIECFDISHSSGEATVASCVVFDRQGAVKTDYRRFNIDNITPGDDYAAMKQALERRYTRLKKEHAKCPELLLIDGGKGQLSQAKEVLEQLQISDITLLGVAKGPSRKPGLEALIQADGQLLNLYRDGLGALHLIQQIRDEAHRFAITGHRARRKQPRNQSHLQDIPGIGAKRRRELLKHFGGLAQVKTASINELAKVNGISQTLAEEIHNYWHQQSH